MMLFMPRRDSTRHASQADSMRGVSSVASFFCTTRGTCVDENRLGLLDRAVFLHSRDAKVNDSAFFVQFVDAVRNELVWQRALLESFEQFVVRTIVVMPLGRRFGAATTTGQRSETRHGRCRACLFVFAIALSLARLHVRRAGTNIR